jgi:4-amino-4-deoxy-L-arabinose transferase-like glycosyltransferase
MNIFSWQLSKNQPWSFNGRDGWQKLWKIPMALGCGFAGVLSILFATSQGVGLSADSAAYISAARSFLSSGTFMVPHDGKLVPLLLWPPLFPAISAAPGLIGIDPLTSVRWVNALFFGANIILIGAIAGRMSRAPYLGFLLAAFLILTSTEMYESHAMAWSEPAFIFLAFSGLAALAFYLETDRSLLLLLLAAACIGLAVITRYVGVVLLLVGPISLSVLSRKSLSTRLLEASFFAVVTVSPITFWLARSYLGASSVFGRRLEVHPIALETISAGLKSISSWFLPPDLTNATSGGLVLTAILCVGGLAWWRIVRHPRTYEGSRERRGLFPILGIFIASYFSILVLSISFLDPPTSVDNRTLVPIYVALVVILASSTLAPLPKTISTLSLCFLVMLIWTHLNRAPRWLVQNHASGRGYSSKEWRASPLIQQVKSLPSEATIFSNGADAIYLLANRISRDIPLNPVTAANIAELDAALNRGDAYLVYFTRITGRDYFARLEDLKKRLDLRVDLDAPDGQVLVGALRVP